MLVDLEKKKLLSSRFSQKTNERICLLKYIGPILHVTWPALGSDDLNFDQSGMSIQILPEPRDMFFMKLQL